MSVVNDAQQKMPNALMRERGKKGIDGAPARGMGRNYEYHFCLVF